MNNNQNYDLKNKNHDNYLSTPWKGYNFRLTIQHNKDTMIDIQSFRTYVIKTIIFNDNDLKLCGN